MTQPAFDPSANLGRMLFNLCLSLPWEKMLVKPKLPADYYVPPVQAPRRRQVLASSYLPEPQALPVYQPPPPPPPRPRPVAPAPVYVPPAPVVAPRIDRPGCQAADEAAVALFHLDGLARGKGGFGVLRVSKERLEKAAEAAESIKHPEIASAYRAIAAEMPEVHTPEAAQALKDRLEPVVYDKSWGLGMRCKGALSSEDLAEIKGLADKIAARNKE